MEKFFHVYYYVENNVDIAFESASITFVFLRQ